MNIRPIPVIHITSYWYYICAGWRALLGCPRWKEGRQNHKLGVSKCRYTNSWSRPHSSHHQVSRERPLRDRHGGPIWYAPSLIASLSTTITTCAHYRYYQMRAILQLTSVSHPCL